MCFVNQVTVSDTVSPHNFSCQLTSSSLALELLRNNMNSCYLSAVCRHSRLHDADDDVSDMNTSGPCLDVTASSDVGSSHVSNLERPLGVHLGDLGEDTADSEQPVNVVCEAEDHTDDGVVDAADMLLTSDQLQPGLCCAAMFTDDGCWYRAKVKSVQDDIVQIVFIDYGTEAAVGIGDLRYLKERFTSPKMMSFRCSLEGWEEAASTDVVERFQSLVLNRKLIADALSMTTDECSNVKYVVRLLDMGLSVSDRLKNPDAYKPVSVCVTSAMSPHDFWCHCVDDASTTELPLLMDLIADLYRDDQQPGSSDLDLDDEEMLYAAKYTDDVWYRAKIISSHQSSQPTTVDTLFVDYGMKTEVSSSDLRLLPENCRTLPPQAVHCRLAGIEPTSGDPAVWDDASMSRFVELVHERSFQLYPVTVVTNSQGDIVELCGRLLDGDKDIGVELVDSGYAVDSTSVKYGSVSNVEHSRRSSSLSEERCSLFVSFDAGSDALDEVVGDTVAVSGAEIVSGEDGAQADTDVIVNGVVADRGVVSGDDGDKGSAVENVESDDVAEAVSGEDVVVVDDGAKSAAVENVVVDTLEEAGEEGVMGDDGAKADGVEDDEIRAVCVEGVTAAADDDDSDDHWVPATSYDIDEDAAAAAADEADKADDDNQMEDEYSEAVESLGKFMFIVIIKSVLY